VTLINSNKQIATAVTHIVYAQARQICNSRALIYKGPQLKVKISARMHRHYKAGLVQRHTSAKVQSNYVKKVLVKSEEFERIKRHDTKGAVRSDRELRMRAIMHNFQHNFWESLPLRLLLHALEKDPTNRIQQRELSNFCRLAFNNDK